MNEIEPSPPPFAVSTSPPPPNLNLSSLSSSAASSKDRITVRIRNMKRSSDRDQTPPPRSSKRSRSSVGRYEDSSDERLTPERISTHSSSNRGRRRSSTSPIRPLRSSSSSRYLPPGSGSPGEGSGGGGYLRDRERERERDRERSYSSYNNSGSSSSSYKVLCVSALHPKASDEVIKDTLYREYKKYGDLSIRLTHDLDERVAYVCFRNAEDARDAKHGKPRIIIYDKVALVEAVYEVRSGRSITPPHHHHHHLSDYYYSSSSRSPDRDRERDRHDARERYAHAHAPPLRYERFVPPHLHHTRGGREALPMPPHHEYHHPNSRPLHHHHLSYGGGGGGGSGGGGGHHLSLQQGGAGGPRLPSRPFEKVENKKDKFPNYLHHIQPEDDPLATRTLFAGNLEINITEEELRRIFGRYGGVEDIDIKRPPPGTGNAFAFVRFHTLDMAHRAKVELSGQYIGKFQCKIGYGKATPTTRIWVGGLGPWTSITQLEREFDRFGAIKKIDYSKGDIQAYILYDSIDAAQAAVKEMRGFPLGGQEHRLRTDFADVTPNSSSSSGGGGGGASGVSSRNNSKGYYPPPSSASLHHHHHDDYDHAHHHNHLDYAYGDDYPSSSSAYKYNKRDLRGERGEIRDKDGSRRLGFNSSSRYELGLSGAGGEEAGSGGNWKMRISRSRSPICSVDSDSDSGSRRAGLLASSRTLPEVARKCSTVWQGALILKNSLFPAKFHLIDGDSDIVDGLMKDEDGKHQLRITQRLRLDQPKLEDVQKRISSASSHAIFLGMAGSTASLNNERNNSGDSGAATTSSSDASVQTRPLRNLVSYLKQKEAAGVISLLNKETEATGVLYSFPPCAFSAELLKRTCHNLPDDALKEDHLVIVVVRGGAT